MIFMLTFILTLQSFESEHLIIPTVTVIPSLNLNTYPEQESKAGTNQKQTNIVGHSTALTTAIHTDQFSNIKENHSKTWNEENSQKCNLLIGFC